MSGSPAKENMASRYNGTTTVSLKKGPVNGVPISIKLMGPIAMSLWIEPAKTESHFGKRQSTEYRKGLSKTTRYCNDQKPSHFFHISSKTTYDMCNISGSL